MIHTQHDAKCNFTWLTHTLLETEFNITWMIHTHTHTHTQHDTEFNITWLTHTLVETKFNITWMIHTQYDTELNFTWITHALLETKFNITWMTHTHSMIQSLTSLDTDTHTGWYNVSHHLHYLKKPFQITHQNCVFRSGWTADVPVHILVTNVTLEVFLRNFKKLYIS